MSRPYIAALIADYLARGGPVKVGPTLWAAGALHCRCKHWAVR
jgi:hypothetical protein